jgi:hypothetical protein
MILILIMLVIDWCWPYEENLEVQKSRIPVRGGDLERLLLSKPHYNTESSIEQND